MNRVIFWSLLLLAVPLFGDIVTLNDGTKIEGHVKRTPDGYVITDTSGAQKVVAASDVQSVELKKAPETPAGAEQSLASLRRSAENLTDPNEAVQRYQSFIAQNPGTPAANTAGQDLAQWQDRASKGMTKVGDRWVTRQQLAELQASGNAAAQQILPALQANPAQGAQLIDNALAANPASPALLYLKGVVLYRQNQLVPARKAFESVASAFPQHAPTHNNLAVILYQTRSQMPALQEYDKAMLADPGNRQILDNVAEALHALPASQAKNDLAKKVAADFNAQDAGLQSQMASQGLKRLGAQWVSDADYARLQSAQADTQRQQEAANTTANNAAALQAQIRQLDQQIAVATQNMNQAMALMQQMAQQNAGARGRQTQLPGQSYYQLQQQAQALQQQVQTLTQQRDAKQKELDQLPRANSPTAQAPTTQPGFSGKQSIFDEQSLPGAKPTIQPAKP